MILIDFLEELELTDSKAKVPRLYYANEFSIQPTEHRDNEHNVELSDFNRLKVTRITYFISAIINTFNQPAAVFIKEYDTEEEAEKVYDEVIDAIARGDKIYSFRRVLKDGTDNGNSSES